MGYPRQLEEIKTREQAVALPELAMKKPRIKRMDFGMWKCSGDGWTRWGKTPELAYIKWRESKPFALLKQVLIPKIVTHPTFG